ncbi:MAG: NAD(P)-dependent glycerol-3-phosphate dehydrogenase [Myxococcales bacterium]|nr:NAD(P)-dependent glycerol-3-phosphate dehydrogenase [Myxococcales bacterium]
MSSNTVDVAVLGAGSWGTALAVHMSDNGHRVRLWTRRAQHARAMRDHRENQQYLRGQALPPQLFPTSDLAEALSGAEYVLSVIPSQHTREAWLQGREHLPSGVPVLCASKGVERGTLNLMSQVLSEVLPGHPTGFVGGPSFAREVAGHLPTTIVIGSSDDDMARTAQRLMSCAWMRAYVSHDVVGVELGGALKNVVAIACGISDGLGLGANARAGLITRGLAEISRLAVKMGADPLTLAGLAGMGDLVLTCTGDLSRNRRVGLALGAGRKLDEILAEMGEVAEGVETTLSASQLAEREGIEMPIVEQVRAVIYDGKAAAEAVGALMGRELKRER